jgi:hypothetical protein
VQIGALQERDTESTGRILTKTLAPKVFCKALQLLAEQPGQHSNDANFVAVAGFKSDDNAAPQTTA